MSGRIQTHLAGGGRASTRGSRDSLPLVHLPDKMPGPPAPRWALPFLLPGALSPRTRPSGALHPLAGAPRPPTPRPRSLGRPPYFRLVARGRRHRSEATGLAGPAALKLQLPAGSTQSRMRAAGRWRIPRVRERGGACAGVSATLALRMRAVGCRSERERGRARAGVRAAAAVSGLLRSAATYELQPHLVVRVWAVLTFRWWGRVSVDLVTGSQTAALGPLAFLARQLQTLGRPGLHEGPTCFLYFTQII